MNPSRTRYEPVIGSMPIRLVEENYLPLIYRLSTRWVILQENHMKIAVEKWTFAHFSCVYAKKSLLRWHRPRSLRSLAHLEITFAKCRPYSSSLAIFSKCGLRPRVEWRGSNFGRRLLKNSYLAILERIFQHSPEATATLRSPNTRKTSPKVNFCSFFLHLCVFFCTFAPNLANGHLCALSRKHL
jgi:hypothetical protein